MKRTRNPVSGKGEALPFVTLPLWQWAANKPPTACPTSRAVAYVARRHRLSPYFAALAAFHSGLGGHNHD